jgi:hypothetical protein
VGAGATRATLADVTRGHNPHRAVGGGAARLFCARPRGESGPSGSVVSRTV